MSKYGHMVKFNGKYYKPGEEVPDNIPDAPQRKEEVKKEKPVEKRALAENVPISRVKKLEQTARAMEKPSNK